MADLGAVTTAAPVLAPPGGLLSGIATVMPETKGADPFAALLASLAPSAEAVAMPAAITPPIPVAIAVVARAAARPVIAPSGDEAVPEDALPSDDQAPAQDDGDPTEEESPQLAALLAMVPPPVAVAVAPDVVPPSRGEGEPSLATRPSLAAITGIRATVPMTRTPAPRAAAETADAVPAMAPERAAVATPSPATTDPAMSDAPLPARFTALATRLMQSTAVQPPGTATTSAMAEGMAAAGSTVRQTVTITPDTTPVGVAPGSSRDTLVTTPVRSDLPIAVDVPIVPQSATASDAAAIEVPGAEGASPTRVPSATSGAPAPDRASVALTRPVPGTPPTQGREQTPDAGGIIPQASVARDGTARPVPPPFRTTSPDGSAQPVADQSTAQPVAPAPQPVVTAGVPAPAPVTATLRQDAPAETTPDRPRTRIEALERPVDLAQPPVAQAPQTTGIVRGPEPDIAPDIAVASPLAPSGIDGTVTRALSIAQDDRWLDSLTRDIAATAGRDGQLSFRLDPLNLGHLTIHITHSDEGASIRMSADTEAARTILADAQPRLAAEARAQGLTLRETSVDLGGSGTGGGQQRAADTFAGLAQGQSQRDPARDHRIINLDAVERDDTAAAARPRERSDLYA